MSEKGRKRRQIFAHIRVPGLGAAVEAREHSVACRPRSELEGRPTVLCDDSGQRVVSASPAAWRRGVRPGFSRWEAQRRCPGMMVAKADPKKHGYYRQRVVDICGDYSPEVIVNASAEISSDRLHDRPETLEDDSLVILLDLTGTERLFGPASGIAQEIRNRIRVEVGALVSIGLGPNRTIAWLASRAAQPGEVVEVAADQAKEFVSRLPIFAFPGMNRERIEWLGRLGIRRAGELAKLPQKAVEKALGRWAGRLWQIAQGEDPDEPGRRPGAIAPSGGQDDSSTSLKMAGQREADGVVGEADLRPATEAREKISAGLRVAADEVVRELRARGQVGGQITIELVSHDLRVVSARRTLRHPTRSAEVVFHAARDLSERLTVSGRTVRKVRVRVGRLTVGPDGGQLALPLNEEQMRRERLGEMVERVRSRFGEAAVTRGSVFELVRS